MTSPAAPSGANSPTRRPHAPAMVWCATRGEFGRWFRAGLRCEASGLPWAALCGVDPITSTVAVAPATSSLRLPRSRTTRTGTRCANRTQLKVVSDQHLGHEAGSKVFDRSSACSSRSVEAFTYRRWQRSDSTACLAATRKAPREGRLQHCRSNAFAVTANSTCRIRPGEGSFRSARLRSSSARCKRR
jgi:hypothetical protein